MVNKGFIFSLEALFSATVLFMIFLLVSDITKFSYSRDDSSKILSNFVDGTHVALDKLALDELIKLNNDLKTKEILESMPPSICTQVEVYKNFISYDNLFYSYTTLNCEDSWDNYKFSTYSTYLNKTSTSSNIFLIKVMTYARQ